jgi:hypothetical protein
LEAEYNYLLSLGMRYGISDLTVLHYHDTSIKSFEAFEIDQYVHNNRRLVAGDDWEQLINDCFQLIGLY